jgi:hypothetical protein
MPPRFEGWPSSWATAVSPSGQFIAGELQDGMRGPPHRIIRWQGRRPQVVDLGHQTIAHPYSVNDSGTMAGSLTSGGQTRGFTYGDRLEILPPLIPGTESDAGAINHDGVVAGFSDCQCAENWHGVVWTGGEAVDLTTHLDAISRAQGWTIQWAYDIDDDGIVFAAAQRGQQPVEYAYVLLTPGTASK